MKISLLFCFLAIAFSHTNQPSSKFITVKGRHFERNGKPYHFMGTNFWYGLNLGSGGVGGNRPRLIRELERLKAMGVNNLRVMAGSEGPDKEPFRMVPALQMRPGVYNEDVADGLDFLLSEMGKRGMVAIMCLNNFWNWSGGMGQYLVWAGAADSIPYPPPQPGGDWNRYQQFAAQFYSNAKAVSMFNKHIRYIINRKNRYSGLVYKDDPTIMAWELANEPRGINNKEVFHQWIDSTAGLIKKLDPNHLVTTGSEGNTSNAYSGTDMIQDHNSNNIDYATIHIWVQNWGKYDPKHADQTYEPALKYAKDYLELHVSKSEELKKPVVLEEFGISRDGNNHDPSAPVTIRDKYYESLFQSVYDYAAKKDNPLAGCNFWAWAGEGRPRVPEMLWKPGDQFIGDPPHESQGWYSVYDKDNSTIKVIKTFAEKLNSIK